MSNGFTLVDISGSKTTIHMLSQLQCFLSHFVKNFRNQIEHFHIEAMSMKFRTPTITHTLVDNKKNLNSILQLVFLFQIFIINILIELDVCFVFKIPW
jgi:hypothetical protein